MLTVVVLDGIALQAQADPGLEIESAFSVWERYGRTRKVRTDSGAIVVGAGLAGLAAAER